MSAGKQVFSFAMGILYLLFGIVQVVGGLIPGIAASLQAFFIPTDIIPGCVVCLIGAVFLYGAAEMRAKRPGAVAFLYVGMLLSLIFCAITLIDIGAQGVNTVFFGGEDDASWSPVQFVTPVIYLAVPSIAGSWAWGRKFYRELTEG